MLHRHIGLPCIKAYKHRCISTNALNASGSLALDSTATRKQAKVRSEVGLKARCRGHEEKAHLLKHVDLADMGRETRGLWTYMVVGVWRGGG